MAKKYKVKNTNLYLNGTFTPIGSVVELSDKEAARLADILVEVKEKAPANPKSATTKQNKTENGTDSTSKKEDEGSKGNNTQDGGNK